MIAAAAVVAVALVAGAAVFVLGGDDNDTTSKSTAVSTPAVPKTVSPTALLVQTAPDGSATSITLLSRNAGDRGGHLLFIPPGAMTEVPSFGLDAVGKASALGGPALLRATVENLLGIAVDQVVVVDDAALSGLVRPAGALTVNVPERVEEVDAAGRVNVLWDAGRSVVGPDQVPRLLTAKGQGNDLARLARQQAFWQSWLGAMRSSPAALPPAGQDAGLRRFLQAVAVRAGMNLLPVEAVDAGGSQELYRVRQEDLDGVVRDTVPGAVPLTSTGRIRVQVLNGTGQVGQAQQVTVRLVQPPTRARVLYTGNADSFGHAETEVVFYARSQRQKADRIRQALGVGRLVLSRRPLGIVDVTVVVGRDFK